jgi:hypothetical protein
MSTRRDFLIKTAGVSAFAALHALPAKADEATGTVASTAKGSNASTARIKAVVRRDETIIRYGGNGDDYWATWTADDRQYVALQDGAGWSAQSKGEYNSHLMAVSGGPQDARFEEVAGYPELLSQADDPRYYGFGTLAMGERIYQFLCAFSDSSKTGYRWIGAKLIYSPDNGRTWCNQDGSSPVKWESYQERSRKSLVFYEEPQEAFSLLSVLQMGKGYEANRDGYVYVYGTNGNTDGLINQLVLFRVPKSQILRREAYEYFAGMKSDGRAKWVRDIEGRAVVHNFPRGWVNKPRPGECVLEAWLPSVVYNAPLGLYMMANWGAGCSPDGSWFSKPSYLGFWIAPNPWGPWTQIHEETAWTPGNDSVARCYASVIAPKWIAPDGKSFWLVWTDFQGWAEYNSELAGLKKEAMPDGRLNRDQMLQRAAMMRRSMPYYAFNTQRVDLEIG